MKGNGSVICVLLLAIGSALGADVLEGHYNVTEFCTLLKPNSYLVSLESCSNYYQCQSSGPVLLTCPSGQSFNKATQACVAEAQSDCTSGAENPCLGKEDKTFVSYGTECGAWAACANQAVNYTGYCPNGEVFSNGKCIYGVCSNSNGISAPSNVCDVVPPSVYFGTTSSCSEWVICSASGVAKEGNCATPTAYFDVISGTCGYEGPTTCSRVTEDEGDSTVEPPVDDDDGTGK